MAAWRRKLVAAAAAVVEREAQGASECFEHFEGFGIALMDWGLATMEMKTSRLLESGRGGGVGGKLRLGVGSSEWKH